MFWSAQAVKGDVNFVGLLALSLQIFAGYYDWGRIYSRRNSDLDTRTSEVVLSENVKANRVTG